MRTRLLTAWVGIGITMLGGLASAPASAQTFYPMVCRSGGDMSGAIPASGVAGVPSNQTQISFHFSKATAAYSASSETIRPGECAWLDRPLNVSEPTNVRFTLNTRLRVTFRNTSREALVFDSVGTVEGRQINTIMETLMDGDYFWFEATNARESRYNYFNAKNFSAGRPATSSASIR